MRRERGRLSWIAGDEISILLSKSGSLISRGALEEKVRVRLGRDQGPRKGDCATRGTGRAAAGNEGVCGDDAAALVLELGGSARSLRGHQARSGRAVRGCGRAIETNLAIS